MKLREATKLLRGEERDDGKLEKKTEPLVDKSMIIILFSKERTGDERDQHRHAQHS